MDVAVSRASVMEPTLAEQAGARLRYRYGLSETSGVVMVKASVREN
jgi:hypothetical protein